MSDAQPPKTKPPEWISCQELTEQLLDYVSDTLELEMRGRLERHFKLCPPCFKFLREYRMLPQLCQRTLQHAMPDEAAERLTAFLRARAWDDHDPSGPSTS
ncbi:MAG: zf-HC2 domain-containing protein [Myxococcales bacterium]|jgi:hypothetical protein|nr:zf-HC2 domain-containing protein [Myxococcales bacterium]